MLDKKTNNKISDDNNKAKVCISAVGDNLSSALDPRFGRSSYFLIVNNSGKLIKAIKNTGVEAMRGAGISAAQIIAQEKCSVVITGNIGPNAFMVLNTAGIQVFQATFGMTAQQAFEQYKEGGLTEAKQAMPCQPGFGPGAGQGRGLGQGQVQGRGLGQGMGPGRSMSPGQGRGMGRGSGQGQGQGRGRGRR